MRALAIAILCSLGANGQELTVRSEFQRPGPDGEVVAADRGGRPREILSPAVARNSFTSYFLTVRVPAGKSWHLEVGQNPEDAARVVLYRVAHDEAGIPDRLTKVDLPVMATAVDEELVVSYWMDLWVDPGVPVRRIKIEPQLYTDGRWVVYPMEVRVQAATVPVVRPVFWGLPDRAARADAVMISPWRDMMCRGLPAQMEPKEPNVRLLQVRNIQQDVALARRLGRPMAWAALQAGGGLGSVAGPEAWCEAPVEAWQTALSAEWYLKVRDFLYKNTVH